MFCSCAKALLGCVARLRCGYNYNTGAPESASIYDALGIFVLSNMIMSHLPPPPYSETPVNPDRRPLPEGWIQQYDSRYVRSLDFNTLAHSTQP